MEGELKVMVRVKNEVVDALREERSNQRGLAGEDFKRGDWKGRGSMWAMNSQVAELRYEFAYEMRTERALDSGLTGSIQRDSAIAS